MTLNDSGGSFSSFYLDANSHDSNGDTDGGAANQTLGTANFFNYPITEFQFVPGGSSPSAPEPATLGLCGLALLALGAAKVRRRI
jgi:hypothetical protein